MPITKAFQDFYNDMGDRWRADAACQDSDPAIFFPVAGPTVRADVKRAKEICAKCPVRQACLDYSLQLPFPWHGIFGGLTPRERSAIGPRYTRPIEHGTVAGYNRERREGISPCDRCKEANAAYKRQHKERGKHNATDK